MVDTRVVTAGSSSIGTMNGGYVDGYAGCLYALFRPSCTVALRLVQRPSTYLDDQSSLFHDRNELDGWHQSVCWALPAHQRLDAFEASRFDVHFWLVMQHKFVVDERLPQLVFQCKFLSDPFAEVLGIE